MIRVAMQACPYAVIHLIYLSIHPCIHPGLVDREKEDDNEEEEEEEEEEDDDAADHQQPALPVRIQ